MRGRIIPVVEPHHCHLGSTNDLALGTLVECSECGTWWRVRSGEWGERWGRPSRKDRKKITALLERQQQREEQRGEQP